MRQLSDLHTGTVHLSRLDGGYGDGCPAGAFTRCRRVRATIKDKRVLALVNAFLKAGSSPSSATGKTCTFSDTLAQFYRTAYLRWVDATSRRPDVRAARIVEVVDLLAAGIEERPRL
jgi:hypothetical protein